MGSEFISSGTLKPIQIYMPCSLHRGTTELLLGGALVAVVVVVCIILKLIICRKLKP